MMVKKCYPGGKAKAFNITYDDGVEQDVRFVSLLNRYGIKGTFNLNSQLMLSGFTWIHENGMKVKRLNTHAARQLYAGHEIASHTLTHPYMYDLSKDEILRQMRCDKENLESFFDTEIKGFAVPFDYYSETIADCARECGFEYARMPEFSRSYVPCQDYFYWKTGIYHIFPDLPFFVDGFLESKQELAVCQIVGHSYDLDALDLWDTMESICRRVSSHGDIWFCTNLELVRYLKDMEKAIISEDCIYNGSFNPLWFNNNGKHICVQPGECCWLH